MGCLINQDKVLSKNFTHAPFSFENPKYVLTEIRECKREILICAHADFLVITLHFLQLHTHLPTVASQFLGLNLELIISL
jgi:hypothetical protein